MNNNTRKKNKGFTFIELLIVIAIMGTLITVTYTFYFFALRGASTGHNDIVMHKDIRLNLEWIERDIRNAKEIEKITPSHLVMKLFQDPSYFENHIVLSEDSTYKTVEYEVVKTVNNSSILYRREDKSEVQMMKFEKIDENIFKAWTYDMAGNFITFDSVINDSWQRERISLIIINLDLQQGRSKLDMTGSVSPRYLSGKHKQPWWNFNSNVNATSL